ncbi:hypothetical protein C427_2495 [Paraglaciecola psychrophila 170]|jgi:hypothetical protein|uniref:Uncharacterized protein n=1 Tax=Paraglaciecola psychrophila 170 TaxID=1129794 RepID=K6ZMG3_9ALTE|nr:hypothetical protein C427_2495 [Paraglaciecola psychrophila 170]GAC37146.1 hypothetical protein GPSY_1513 [Paraglaciecola psychrophila 170]
MVKTPHNITDKVDERIPAKPSVSLTISSEHDEHITLKTLLNLNDSHNEKSA